MSVPAICVVTAVDCDDLERLHKAVVKAPLTKSGKHALWKAQFALLSFMEHHPTLIPALAQAWRERNAT
ncbi:MAG: hypothetical protein ACRECF_03685 [Methyloceanibacter sp.]